MHRVQNTEIKENNTSFLDDSIRNIKTKLKLHHPHSKARDPEIASL